ncbi:MAG: N-acetylmuramoyl-L-alanine amidase [Provencibacterium sp.]|nr:N-acetylmuramoyl-L-alanine amidase [Provencibacterium sp.]
MKKYRFGATAFLAACYTAAIACILSTLGQTMTVSGPLCSSPVMIIDAGHGGFDGGAEGAAGTVEKDINLPVALKVRDLLTLFGFKVLMTRESDISTCDEGLERISDKKTSDILNRFSMIEAHPEAVFLSIHQNKFPDSSQFGAQMFYGPENEESMLLAGILQQNFREMLQPENEREIKEATDSVYLLYHSPIPSVLIECGFLSNPREEALLKDEQYQNQIAFAIAASVLQYIEQRYAPQLQSLTSPPNTQAAAYLQKPHLHAYRLP